VLSRRKEGASKQGEREGASSICADVPWVRMDTPRVRTDAREGASEGGEGGKGGRSEGGSEGGREEQVVSAQTRQFIPEVTL
jgi:hypothetical protein